MTKEKLAIKLAIDIMERNVSKYINHGIYKVSDADGAVHVEFGEAINILNGMLEKEPCEDAVSRQQLKIALLRGYDIPHEVEHAPLNKGILLMKEKALEIAKDLPSVTLIRPKGEWKYDKIIQNWRCSECNETPKTLGYVGTKEFMTEHFKFCNHCGADMRGKNNEND